jgi:hypothetical protein
MLNPITGKPPVQSGNPNESIQIKEKNTQIQHKGESYTVSVNPDQTNAGFSDFLNMVGDFFEKQEAANTTSSIKPNELNSGPMIEKAMDETQAESLQKPIVVSPSYFSESEGQLNSTLKKIQIDIENNNKTIALTKNFLALINGKLTKIEDQLAQMDERDNNFKEINNDKNKYTQIQNDAMQKIFNCRKNSYDLHFNSIFTEQKNIAESRGRLRTLETEMYNIQSDCEKNIATIKQRIDHINLTAGNDMRPTVNPLRPTVNLLTRKTANQKNSNPVEAAGNNTLDSLQAAINELIKYQNTSVKKLTTLINSEREKLLVHENTLEKLNQTPAPDFPMMERF